MTEQRPGRWRYRVPRYFGSRWESEGRAGVVSCDLDWPRVSIYCEGHPVRDGSPSHADALWLVGSLEVSPDVLAETGAVHWAWVPQYPTGDGYAIRLDRQRERVRPSGQTLAGDRPATKAERLGAGAAEIRTRPVLGCRLCGQRYPWRLEHLQGPAAGLYRAGVRELPLWAFQRAVQSAR